MGGSKTRKWISIQLAPAQTSLNPNLPDALYTCVVGERSDGVRFRVDGQIFVDKIKVLMPKDAAKVGLDLARDLLRQLDTYRECECEQDQPCVRHKPPGLPS